MRKSISPIEQMRNKIIELNQSNISFNQEYNIPGHISSLDFTTSPIRVRRIGNSITFRQPLMVVPRATCQISSASNQVKTKSVADTIQSIKMP